MQIKISKTLEGILARVIFETTKEGINHSLKELLLIGILREQGSLAHQILSAQLKDWELYQITIRIEREIELAKSASIVLDNSSSESFFLAFVEELRQNNPFAHNISTAHAVQAILADRSTCSSRIFEMYAITAQSITEQLFRFSLSDNLQLIESPLVIDVDSHSGPKMVGSAIIEKFGRNLTQAARDGGIDPVIGRDREIERVVQILSRRKKNNPILIGEAGVGKSAIVEGLALRIAGRQVPHTIANKELFSLDISALVAGTKFRGEFEERMQQLLEELRQRNDYIIFIDEIHTIVGAGSTQGSLDTANILKPILARGELQTIGATTLDEYRKNIEVDGALDRRFQRVMVEPTTREQTLQILQQIAPHYQQHHKVKYTAEALEACVELTERYVTDRNFPDKAIDVMDEAGSRVHLQSTILLPGNGGEIASISDIGVEVTHNHIEQVITSMTGIPTERLTVSEMGRLRSLSDHLNGRVIGQNEAVERISSAIRRSRAGLKDENRPMGVFMFVGPTGVGKTLLAKELSKLLFDQHRSLIRIDMSEYSEKHTVSRLIGAPPGYVGYGEGGELTEAVRRHPYAVVLLDEIEKAHSEIFNTMLQLFDEGHLTDGSARRVDFRNTIIIMTSNVGSKAIARGRSQVGYSTSTKFLDGATTPQSDYRKAIEVAFAPEFLNRIDDVILFRTLNLQDVEQIVTLELESLFGRTQRLGYKLRITPTARRRLAKMGFQAHYGARALRRTITDRVEEPLSQLIIDGTLRRGESVVIESDRGEGVKLRVA